MMIDIFVWHVLYQWIENSPKLVVSLARASNISAGSEGSGLRCSFHPLSRITCWQLSTRNSELLDLGSGLYVSQDKQAQAILHVCREPPRKAP